jgi:hypothetical protein
MFREAISFVIEDRWGWAGSGESIIMDMEMEMEMEMESSRGQIRVWNEGRYGGMEV